MAEKRKQEEASDDLFSKRQCVEISDSLKDLNGEDSNIHFHVFTFHIFLTKVEEQWLY